MAWVTHCQRRQYSDSLGVSVRVVQLNGSYLVGLLFLYCQLHTRSSTPKYPVAAVPVNQ